MPSSRPHVCLWFPADASVAENPGLEFQQDKVDDVGATRKKMLITQGKNGQDKTNIRCGQKL